MCWMILMILLVMMSSRTILFQQDRSAPDLPVPCRVNITKEDTYNNGTEFVRVVDEYCKERKFDYHIDSSKREWPKDILAEDKPDDSISYVSIICSRSGALRKKKEGLAPEKRRNRKSNKCGCGYHVEARWDADIHRFTIRSVSLQHTNMGAHLHSNSSNN